MQNPTRVLAALALTAGLFVSAAPAHAAGHNIGGGDPVPADCESQLALRLEQYETRTHELAHALVVIDRKNAALDRKDARIHRLQVRIANLRDRLHR